MHYLELLYKESKVGKMEIYLFHFFFLIEFTISFSLASLTTFSPKTFTNQLKPLWEPLFTM